MRRRKRSIAQGWESINKKREEVQKKIKEKESKQDQIDAQEHENRIKKLKEMGLIK